eukprot:534744_1
MNLAKNATEGSERMQRKMWFRPPNGTFSFFVISMCYSFRMNCFLIIYHTFTEEFRKYLEKNGVVDAITKVLVGLYDEPERPPNVVDYVKRYIGAPTGVDVDAMRLHNNELKQENEELKMRIKHLQQKVDESDNLLQVK